MAALVYGLFLSALVRHFPRKMLLFCSQDGVGRGPKVVFFCLFLFLFTAPEAKLPAKRCEGRFYATGITFF